MANYVVATLAGSGYAGFMDGQGTQSMFKSPCSIVAGSSSNVFVLDTYNQRIRKITPSGLVSTFAGGGTNTLPGYGTNIALPSIPFALATIDQSNTISVSTTWGGMKGFLLRIGNDGLVTSNNIAELNNEITEGICSDSQNNIYLAGSSNVGPLSGQIYRYHPTTGVVETFASFTNEAPNTLASDSADNIYVFCNAVNKHIYRIDQNKNTTTIWTASTNTYLTADGIGTNAGFSELPYAACADGLGNLIFACRTSVRKINIASASVTTIAGSFSASGYANGVGYSALFSWVNGVCISHGQIFVTDQNNQRIRAI